MPGAELVSPPVRALTEAAALSCSLHTDIASWSKERDRREVS
ncbi:terpene synthase family protein [Streptomyces spectabilis]|nr:terpene synthase family protein [Streptomyces spectabilis]